MDTVDCIAGMPAREVADDFTVTDDLAGMPVTDSELDAVEAFLAAALKELLSPDSETTQTSAMLAAKPQGRGAAQ